MDEHDVDPSPTCLHDGGNLEDTASRAATRGATDQTISMSASPCSKAATMALNSGSIRRTNSTRRVPIAPTPPRTFAQHVMNREVLILGNDNRSNGRGVLADGCVCCGRQIPIDDVFRDEAERLELPRKGWRKLSVDEESRIDCASLCDVFFLMVATAKAGACPAARRPAQGQPQP